MAISLPIDLPINFTGNIVTGISLPVSLPVSLSHSSSKYVSGISLPMSLPISLSRYIDDSVAGEKKLECDFTVSLQPYYGVEKLECNITPSGKTVKLPFIEKAWFFPGIFLEENIISTMQQSVNIVENVQALILADFELQSTNVIKVSWYGNTVPGLTIMKKSDADDKYTNAGTYSWSDGSAVIDIASEDYNIYLQGTSNSGNSDIYTIGAALDTLVDPTIAISLNEKIYTFDINYTSAYQIQVSY